MVAGKLVTNPSHSPENAFILPGGEQHVFTYGATGKHGITDGKEGATDAEVAEAIAMASMTRHWSTLLHGLMIDEKAFMDDLYRAFDDRAQVALHRIDAKQWDLLVAVSESTDRVQHMMWRHRDTTHPLYDAAGAAKFYRLRQ